MGRKRRGQKPGDAQQDKSSTGSTSEAVLPSTPAPSQDSLAGSSSSRESTPSDPSSRGRGRGRGAPPGFEQGSQQQWGPRSPGATSPQEHAWGPPPGVVQAPPQWGPRVQSAQQAGSRAPAPQPSAQGGFPPQQGGHRGSAPPGGPRGPVQQPGGPRGTSQQQPRGPAPSQAQPQTGRGWGATQPVPSQGGLQQQRGLPRGVQRPAEERILQEGAQAGGDTSQLVPKLQQTILASAGDGINILSKINKSGKNGRLIPIYTNHFELKLGRVKQVIHYDVAIDPDKPKKILRSVMEQFKQKHYPKYNPAYDGSKSLYCYTRLPFGYEIKDTITMVIEVGGRPKEYKVAVKEVATISLDEIDRFLSQCRSNVIIDIPASSLQALDVVLRHSLASRNINVGRSFFSLPEGNTIRLGNGMEMYRGTFQAISLGWKTFLNVDVANKAFPSAISMIDLYQEMIRNFNPSQAIDDRDRDGINKHIKGLRVVYCIPNNPASKKTYRVNGICGSSRAEKFKKENSNELLSIEQYFLADRNVRLQYPLLPCLWVGMCTGARKVLLPSEFCTILPGQVVNRKLGPFETREMIKHCATSTKIRKQAIQQSMLRANFNADPTVKDFDIKISSDFQKVDARVLEPPPLLYGNSRVVRVNRGVWNPEVFMTGVKINSWTILNVDRYTKLPDLEKLGQMVIRKAKQLGVTIGEPLKPFASICTFPNQLFPKLKEYFSEKKGKVNIIFVVISEQDKVYNFVKEAAEIAVGCLTQCIKSRTLGRLNDSTVSNILLKVNAKLNGRNHYLQKIPPLMKEKITMVMGADVTHPSPDSRDIPSVAAITASHDPGAFQYNICWRLQPPTVEVIEDMEEVTREQILYFAKKNGGPPQRIIFYRDGVSDGQFRTVLSSELQAIRRACKKINQDYKPHITFLVVQKRHHTRLFPQNDQDSQDKNFNVPAGTCVDTQITNPTTQNFFLVSHASIQGVAKPTKYVTLFDDADFSNDDIECFTYYLCHLFARCTRSVSYPAPTYYAHLAAARAKVYIETKQLNMNNLKYEENKLKIQECIVKDLPMFFI